VAEAATLHSPLGLLAELTHRCPLGCPYCSNPLALEPRDGELDAATWSRVFKEAAGLGVMHVHLSGGEPGARRDLVDIAANAREAGLYTNLITSGVGITTRTMRDLWEAGLDHVQVSIQDADAVSADRIAGYRGAFQRKHALAAEAVRLGLPLTVNLVVHRANIGRISDMVDLALKLKASRIEIAHVQYYGWALKSRSALMPTAEQVSRAVAEVEELRRKHQGQIVIDAVVPDYHARLPKPCVGGWGRRSLNVTPSGRVLPCHAAESIPGLTFLERARAFAGRYLGPFAGVQRLPRHRFPARALCHLRAARDRFRRLPLPGFSADRGRPGGRPGMPSVAAS
jgi:pyrroloquinoline quinone biosynthesis protein E